ncbi:hypothetical protein E0L16_12380 [Enterobacter quasihormaechei]|uniref:Uncharacterized protein n=1 Tax=Enterobacter quasihormaechei TaxID=2529382 RepID=A0AAE8QWC4_9ENTR|nr:hypothetical protein E0L16_12380 [Enterobacter quasihormaechei]
MPGGAALTGPTNTVCKARRPGKAKPPPGFCFPADLTPYVDLHLIIHILPPWVILNHSMLPVSFPWALNTPITAD